MDRKRGLPLGPLDNWNCSQNSQSQKISVGVPVDASAEARMGFTAISTSFQQKSKSSLGKSVVEDMMKGLGSFLGGKKLGTANQGGSGWISPKNLDANKENESFTPYNGVSLQSGGVKHKLPTSLTGGKNKNSDHSKEPAPVTNSKVEVFDHGVDRRRLTLERKIKGGNAVEEFKFTAEQTTRVDRTRNHGNGNVASCGASEALRLKLFESLGTVPAQKDLGEDVPIDESISLTGQILDNEKDSGKVKAATYGGIDAVRQKSDTLVVHPRNDQTIKVPAGKNGTSNSKKSLKKNKEMKSGYTKLANVDSDYEPCRAVRTPVTRSASRKRSTTRLSKLQNKDPESFLANSDKVGCQGGSFDFGNLKAPSGKTYISKKLGDILPAAEKIVSRGSKKKFRLSPSNVCSTTPGNAGSPESFTPKLAAQAHVETKFPKEQLPEKTALSKSFPGIGRSKSTELRSKASYCGNFRELYSESAKVKQDLKVPVQGLGDLSPPMEDKKEHKQLSLTTPEDRDDESFESFKAGSRLSSGTCTPRQSPHMLKNFRSDAPERRRESYNRSPSPKKHRNKDEDEDEDGDGDGDEDKDDDTADGYIMSGKNSEDPLSRAISQFAFVLERYKNKVKLHTGEKISEILASAASGIHSQLRAIESQISAEADKLSSHSKTKRKRLEIKIGEQCERLRVTHDKYKEEVYRLLDEYKTTLEELEAYHLEMKGNVDRQNASCRKLLLQAEEGIYARLCEAERNIAIIRDGARKKMRSLKTCLNEVF